MKKINKALVLLALLTASALAVSSCDNKPPVNTGDETTIASDNETTVSANETTAVSDEDCFDAPKTMDEVRARTIDYFNQMAAVKWRTKETLDYKDDCPWTTKLVYERGQYYYGLPYSTYLSPKANLAQFEEYIDESGFYTGPTEYRELIGNDCGAMRQAWGYSGALCDIAMNGKSFQMIPGESAARKQKVATAKVGEYDDSRYSSKTPTYENINKVNGEDVMYEAYSQLKSCDIIAHRFKLASNGEIAQHIRMLVADAVTVRLGNGKIAASKSYITFSEQTSTVHTIDGKKTTWVLNDKMTFGELYDQGYIPLTLLSLQKETPDAPVMTASGFSKPENFGSAPMLKGTVKCNYNILKLECSVTDKDGNVVSSLKHYPYDLQVLLTELSLSTPVKELPAGDYHFTCTATIGFGTKTVADFDFSK